MKANRHADIDPLSSYIFDKTTKLLFEISAV